MSSRAQTRSVQTRPAKTRPATSTRAAPGTTVRRAGVPGRRGVVGAVVMVLLGSFMPWLDTAAGTVSGARGPGIWTFYAAMLGLAAALLPLRRVAATQAVIFGLVAVALPVWQLGHVLSLVGFGGWMPGPGLVLVLGGGVLAAVSGVKMWTARPVTD